MASATGFEGQSRTSSLEKENEDLLHEITELCKRTDRKNAEVIMLIGKSGAGKSAIINTIHKVLTGKYFQVARQGRGRAQSVTLDLHRYDNCAVSLETITDAKKREKIEEVVTMLPHIVDCAGLGDVNTPELREILELLIGGYIPPETHIEALEKKQTQYGVGCLKETIYKVAKPEWRVTKVVFVQSCRDTIPKNLIECLTEVLKITDPATLRRKYTADVFLLITKYDLVEKAKHERELSDANGEVIYSRNTEAMELEEFEKVENEIAPEFNIVGALESNRIRWVSFTDETGTSENPEIKNIALKFITRMVEPGAPAPEQDQTPVVGTSKSIELYMFKLKNQIKQFFLQNMQVNITPGTLLVALVFVVVIAVLYKLLTAGV